MALSVVAPTSQQTIGNGEIEELNAFARFDVVSDPSDHFYFNSGSNKKNGGDCFSNLSSGVHKKIMQEWRILEKHLPDSIFVRVYENRIDLLRAVIIGAAGTPYHDGLYFFDVAFPADYPNRPPCVYYKSFGLRINPNLYSTGRVCLSLLNTWTGKKSEKWNPKESTVLQVLVSVQALVLNEKPYYNEPGHGIWPGRVIWEKRSNAYNEDVFVLSCKTTLFLLRRPPKNFEVFVARHFRDRAVAILSACNAYVNGRFRVGYFTTDAPPSNSRSADVSERFRGSMAVVYRELVSAFAKNGTPTGAFVDQPSLRVEKRTAAAVAVAGAAANAQLWFKKKKKTNGMARRVLGKLKRVLGLKKKGGGQSGVKKKKNALP